MIALHDGWSTRVLEACILQHVMLIDSVRDLTPIQNVLEAVGGGLSKQLTQASG